MSELILDIESNLDPFTCDSKVGKRLNNPNESIELPESERQFTKAV